jgi:hypothetical protein
MCGRNGRVRVITDVNLKYSTEALSAMKEGTGKISPIHNVHGTQAL